MGATGHTLSLSGQMERLTRLLGLAHDTKFTSLVLNQVRERVKDLPPCEVPWETMELRLRGMISRILWAVGIAETTTLAFRDSFEPDDPWLDDPQTTKALSRGERWAAAQCALALPEIQSRIQAGAIPQGYMLVLIETIRQHVTELGKLYRA